MSSITVTTDDGAASIMVGAPVPVDVGGTLVEVRQVELDALPLLSLEFEGTELSTTFATIQLDVRLNTGEKLPIRSAIIDDDLNGFFHFEFLQDEVPNGVHQAEVIFSDINVPTSTFRLPIVPLRLFMRERV